LSTFPTEQKATGVPLVRDARSPMASFIASFLVAKTLAPKSRIDYARYLREFDEFTSHESLKKALTLDNAAQWIEQVRPRGIFAARNAAHYLKSFATWIAKSRHIVIQGGGSLLAGLEVPQTPHSTRQAFTDAQLDAIWDVLSGRSNRDRKRALAYVHLLNATGLRRNEARQVALKDVHLDLEANRSWVHVRAQTSKGMKERQVRIDRMAVGPIHEYIVDDRPDYTGPKNKPEPLFLTEHGQPFTEYGFGSWASRISDQIEKVTGTKREKGQPRFWKSHLMRHTWATNYHRGMKYTGNTVYDQKREGGWADLRIVLTYAHDRPWEELLDMETPASALRERRTGRPQIEAQN
jgi:site-specific recombinase XerD